MTTPTQEEIKAVVTDLRASLIVSNASREVFESTQRVIDLIERLAAERAALYDALHAIKYEVAGGEDVPGSAHALSVDDVKEEMERLRGIERNVASPSVSAHIKPLVWTRIGDHAETTSTPMGDYKVRLCRDGLVYWWRSGNSQAAACDTMEQAKAAVLADLVERISPVLTVGPSDSALRLAVADLLEYEPTREDFGRLPKHDRLYAIAKCAFDKVRAMLNASPAPGGDQK